MKTFLRYKWGKKLAARVLEAPRLAASLWGHRSPILWERKEKYLLGTDLSECVQL